MIAQSQTPTLTYTFPNVGDYTAVCTIDGQADLGACTESVYVNDIQYPDVFVEKDRLTGVIAQNGDIVTFKIRF